MSQSTSYFDWLLTGFMVIGAVVLFVQNQANLMKGRGMLGVAMLKLGLCLVALVSVVRITYPHILSTTSGVSHWLAISALCAGVALSFYGSLSDARRKRLERVVADQTD